MTDDLIFKKSGARAEICFNRPHHHNAMTFAMYEGLEAICDDLDADPNVRIAVLRGAGDKAFVAGTDIAQFQHFKNGDDAIAYEARIDRVVGRLERLKCTTIAVLHGVCAGGGVPIALACDFRYADPALRLGVPIARTLGNCLSMANVALLLDFVGVARAKELLMLGRMITAPEALDAGVVNAVYPSSEMAQRVEDVITEIQGLAPLTLTAMKTAIRRTQMVRRASPEAAEDLIRLCYGSEDFHNAVEAFLQKRRPVWHGR
ncbi:enoyl-CoA hydratase/isomerase family protein [Castellaniella sp.]|uniref:enoyl-CoA hydratase/isomerase family protein n=1 Tax=Castellaniella sp. TaxID=1955812 RepID=UPI003A927A4D